MMLNSLRAQLTLWYTGVLALVLVSFAGATYAYLAHQARQRTDDSLADTANSFISSFIAEAEENRSSDAGALEAVHEFHFADQLVLIYDESQRLVAASELTGDIAADYKLPGSALPSAALPLWNSAAHSSRAYASLPNGKAGLRACAVALTIGARNYTVVVLRSLADQEEALRQARRAFYVAVPIALLIASLGGYLLARKNLGPIITMGDQAALIGASNLNERLPVPHPNNELGRLAQIFNDLLARLDRSFEQQRHFMADASHELRTPVAIVCGESEVALSQQSRTPEDYRESLAIVHDEGRRLTRIVEDLFTLARADAGQYPLLVTNFYLEETIGECVRSVRSLALENGLNLCYQPPADEIPFRGDEALISRMVLNLLDNAIKNTPQDGTVRIDLQQDRTECRVKIADTGTGIPAEAQPHIFERFFRADKARSRAGDTSGSGAGLGLSIAQWIAEMHGGQVVLDHSDLNGTTFIVSLMFP
jgi:heavy metal sensor kinase